jgi:PAS domain-containing protein
MTTQQPPRNPHLITIPSSDPGFRAVVDGVAVDPMRGPADLERQLRNIFPRVVVRDRDIAGEPRAWYVYRDGRWRSPVAESWWDEASVPRVVVGADGWLREASTTAAGLLGIDGSAAREHHFTDFVVPGTLDDSLALFEIVNAGNELAATVRLRPTSGDIIAVDIHAARRGEDVVAVFRLATDIDSAIDAPVVERPERVITTPAPDVAFRAYVLGALGRMPEPTVEGLVLRVRRLYPHASVQADGDAWRAEREPGAAGRGDPRWWSDADLPRVRYDAQALILEANGAAREFLGHDLVGHHWQDFVTPGSSEEVAVMLEILGEIGAAESRFRMPRADGTLVEFDSYTTVAGEELVTVMRPVENESGRPAVAAASTELDGSGNG